MITEKDIGKLLNKQFKLFAKALSRNSYLNDYWFNEARINNMVSNRTSRTSKAIMDKVREDKSKDFVKLIDKIREEEKPKIEMLETLNGRTIFKD